MTLQCHRAGAPVAGIFLVCSMLLTEHARAQLSDYTTQLTNTRRAVTNFNVETIRGMAFDDLGRMLALNTHGSSLLRFDNPAAGGAPLVFRTINNPCAVAAFHRVGDGRRFALVVGGGTHGLAVHDANTGFIENFVKLPSEPMDIVVDTQRELAFVSCGGAYDEITPRSGTTAKKVESGGVVVEIELQGFREVGKHFIPQARPMFLNLEMGPNANDNVVYVAAHLSGNRTTFRMFGAQLEAEVVQHDTADADVFSIDEVGNVNTFIKDAGTLLTGHRRHPNGNYWVLGVDSNNFTWTTERLHRGRFATNQIALFSAASGVTPASLDTTGAGKPASFPIDVGFDDRGLGYITSSTGDVVRIVDSSGNAIRNVPLPDGAIPRSILVTDTIVWVYLWGSNEIYGFDASTIRQAGANTPIATLNLGVDPLPDAVKRGRTIWYDADRSLDDNVSPPVAGKVSCNTCHPRGGMDMLAWRIEDGVRDQKDMMVTQSLMSSEDTFPYHWRGERSLSDFNEAFSGLLGGQELSTALTPQGSSELADFESFVFSLQGAANPREHLYRQLDDSKTLELYETTTAAMLVGHASQGENAFHTFTGALAPFNPIRCVDCHGQQSGTNGVITTDVLSVLPAQSNSDVPHLRQLSHKLLQKALTRTVNGVPLLGDRPLGGFGLTQDGDDHDIIEFLNGLFFAAPQPQRGQLRIDTSAFVSQFDEGIAPFAHHAVWYDDSQAGDMDLMIKQADKGWIDLAVTAYIAPFVLSMWYDPSDGRFHTMMQGQPGDYSDTLAGLQTAHGNGVGLLFVGLPPGNGFRFAVDRDNDGIPGQLEIALGLDPLDPDWDNDGYPDGYELQVQLANPGGGVTPFVNNTPAQVAAADQAVPTLTDSVFDHATGRISKHFVTFSEPVTYTVQVERKIAGVWTAHGPLQIHGAVRTIDTLVGQGLLPTNGAPDEYRLVVAMRDLAGNPGSAIVTAAGGGSIFTAPAVFGPAAAAFATDALTVTSPSTGVYHAQVNVQGLFGGASNPVVLFRVAQFDAVNRAWTILPTTAPSGAVTRVLPQVDFGSGTAPDASWGGPNGVVPPVNGPFVVSAPVVGGAASADFTLPGVSAGTQAIVVVLGVLDEIKPGGVSLNPPRFVPLTNQFWQMPMSPNEGRAAKFTTN
ncbi:MAG: hypothetical protein U1E73_10360 [Planctomycetota bacterium]